MSAECSIVAAHSKVRARPVLISVLAVSIGFWRNNLRAHRFGILCITLHGKMEHGYLVLVREETNEDKWLRVGDGGHDNSGNSLRDSAQVDRDACAGLRTKSVNDPVD